MLFFLLALLIFSIIGNTLSMSTFAFFSVRDPSEIGLGLDVGFNLFKRFD